MGPQTERRLRALGIATIGELARQPRQALVREFGRAYGTYLHEASRSVDDSELEPERTAKSVSAEHTFPADTVSRILLWQTLRDQAEEVAGRLRELGLRAAEVAVKHRYADWQTITRQQPLPVATDDPQALALAAAALMRRHLGARAPRPAQRARRRAPSGPEVAEQLPLPFAAVRA